MRFRKKKIGEISLEDTFDTEDEFGVPRKQIGRLDLNMTGLFDRLGLNRAIAQLPAGYKKMFLLHDVAGYGHEEIAKILGCSVGNSKSQLHKARVRLRKLLREQGDHAKKTDRASRIDWALPARASAS
jgi:RNA polymerase sigma-70 factor (ECF subfamily)